MLLQNIKGGMKMKRNSSRFLVLILLVASFLSMAPLVSSAPSCTITSLTPTIWIKDFSGTLKTETTLGVNNPGTAFNAWCKVTVAGIGSEIQSLGSLANGNITVYAYARELTSDNTNVTYEIFDNSACSGSALSGQTATQKKIKHWRLYVGHDSHCDVGYTDYQENLKDSTWPSFMDHAFTYITNTNSWSADSQFRYPVEASYELYDGALNVRNADWVETLKTNLANGRFSYAASMFTTCTEAMGAEELVRENYFSERYMKDILGFGSTKVWIESDNSGPSWAAVDALLESGIKYYHLRRNPDSNAWDYEAYPHLFYLQGRNPNNKLLIYHIHEYYNDPCGFRGGSAPKDGVSSWILNHGHESDYPADAIMTRLSNGGDNGDIVTNVHNNIKALNDLGYAWPKVINSDGKDFYDYIDTNWKSTISASYTYSGTLENAWNKGVGCAPVETAMSRNNAKLLPVAETLATIASVSNTNAKYSYENIADSYKKLVLFDEHTWGPANSSVPEDQWRWKRNTSVGVDATTKKTLNDACSAINTLIPATNKTIVVYNSLGWTRNDLVKVNQSDLPAHFDIYDIDAAANVKYQKLSDGTVAFVAPNVPGIGYKCFRINSRSDDPTFTTSISTTANTIENNYFKVTFDSTGAVTSIIDKQNGNREIVKNTAADKLNSFQFYVGDTKYSVSIAAASNSVGPIMGTFTNDGACYGVDSLKRKIILYDSIPRIDVENAVVIGAKKSDDDEGFFAFPWDVSNFLIKHAMPVGDVRPQVDQLASSCTRFYTVGNWIDLANQSDYGIMMSMIDAPLVQYSQRNGGTISNPYVYGWAFNNEWYTNFQKQMQSDPIFRYSIKTRTGADWKAGRADKFGAEATTPLQTSIISGSQSGSLDGAKKQFVGINQDNVALTTFKMAEANGEGIILRFNETKGVDTTATIDLSYFSPTSATETDLVENDTNALTITNNTITFTIKGFGWKTVRIKRGSAPAQVSGLSATMNSNGAQITWSAVTDAACYEVFRNTNSSFTPGSGSYLASVSANHYFDPQVKTGLANTYYYKVKAVKAGLKGTASAAVQAISGTVTDTTAPAAPANLKGQCMYWNDRINLSWEPATDNLYVKGYRIYRDGTLIKDQDVVVNSFLDVGPFSFGTTLTYTVRAYDAAGNVSGDSNSVMVTTISGATPTPSPTPDPNDPIVSHLATVSVSSQYNSNFAGIKAIDGIIGIHETGEWASLGEINPWIQLNWAVSRTINKIRIYDRPNTTDAANGGTLSFSDTSTITVSGIPNDGSMKEITFADKTVTWVKFQVSGGSGMNVGLSEFEVYKSGGSATATPAPTSTPTPTPTPTPTSVPGTAVMVDDFDASVTFSGSWTAWSGDPLRYNSTEHYTNTTGNYVQFTFTGSEIHWYGLKHSNRGMADVYIDGTLDATVDQYGSTLLYQQDLYTKILPSGTHTIKIVCKGVKNPSSSDYYTCCDAFKYVTGATPTPTPSPTPTPTPAPLFSDNFNDNILSSAWTTFNGTWSESGQILSQTSTGNAFVRKATISNSGVNFGSNHAITAKVRVDSWSDGDYARAGVSLFTNTTDGYGYNLLFHNNHSTVQFLDDGIAWGPSYTFNWSNGTWYWFKLKMESGTLYGKVWQDGSAEPSNWPYSWAKSGRSGYPAVNGGAGNTGEGTSSVSFDDVSVTSN
jgi:hypothetical protein